MRTRWVLFSFLFLGGCGWSFPSLPSNPPHRQFRHMETEVLEPRFVVIEGKTYPVMDRVERTYDVGLDQQQPKIPAWKRALNALFGWSAVGAIMVILLTVLGIPALPMLILAIRRIRNANKHLSQIVTSVDNGLAILSPDQQLLFKTELSKAQDSDVRKRIARLKEEAT